MTSEERKQDEPNETGRLGMTTIRRESIVSLLRSAGQSLSAPDIANELLETAGQVDIEPASFRRKVQRDLVIMAGLGRVRREGVKWEAVDQDADFVFESLAGAVALDLLLRTASWAIPEAILDGMADTRAIVSAKLKNAFSGSPAVRWLKSLRADDHPVFNLDRPLVDADVRTAVEQAIMESRKISLSTERTGSVIRGRTLRPWVVSISHYILKLPDMPAIGWWDEKGEYCEQGLETFIHAEVLDEPASLLLDPSHPDSRHRLRLYDTLEIEVVADRFVMSHVWKYKQISKHLTIVESYDNGSARCTFESAYSRELIDFLVRDGGHVEVVRPTLLRDMVYEQGLLIVANYSSSNESLRSEASAARRQLECYLGD